MAAKTDLVNLSAYKAARVRDARLAWLAANGPCQHCGSEDQLELDHVDPATKVSHRVWSWAPARREVELAKCQVLCRPCHRAKTTAEMQPDHGSTSMYRRGCRCDLCRAAQATASAAYRGGIRGRPRRRRIGVNVE